MNEDTVTQEELNKAMAERQQRLADLEARTNQQNSTAAGKAGFPAASAAAPASSAVPAKNDKNYTF